MCALNVKAVNLDADALLAIPVTQPEKLFPHDENGIKDLFRELVRKWHPDRNKTPKAAEVFRRVTELKDKAEEKLTNGGWHTPGLLEIKQPSGKTATIRYLKKHDFELGEMYICKDKIAYVVRPEFKDLFNNAVDRIRNTRFAAPEMETQFRPQLPKFVGTFEAADGRQVLVIERDPQMILLRDLADHHKGRLDPKHVAWIISRLLNIACYLETNGLTHNAISVDTVYVLPKDETFKPTPANKPSKKDHSMALLGGWWYATPQGRPLLGLPGHALNYAPRDLLASGRADSTHDRHMIRIIGRELLGDVSGVKLQHDKSISPALAEWLSRPGSGDAITDFKAWDQVLKDSFGARRFVELPVSASDIYQPLTT